MSDQYQPTEYYDWPNREHGHFLHNPVNKHYEITSYDYVPYEYYGGDEIHSDNVVFRQSEYVTYDLTHIRMVNRSDIHMYDTSGISIFDSGMITQYTSAAPSARKFVVDQYGRVGIGMDHNGPHGGTDRKGLLTNRGEEPSFDLDVKGQVGVEDYIYHNDNTETYMLFGSDLSAHDVNIAGEIHTHYPDDQDEINFRVGGIDMLQMQTRDVFYAESGTTATGVQDHITFNKYQSDVDYIVRSVDEPNMLFIDSKNNRISIGDSEDAPQATLEIKNHPSRGAFNVPLVQMNNMDTDKQLLDINAQNINADVISVSANKLVTAHVMTVTADSLTTGDVYNVTADKLTTGSIYHATTTSNSKEQVSLFHLESTGDRGHDVFQTVLMDLNFDTTAGKGARALRIDSEQTTGKVVEIDAQRITSGIAMTVSATDMTTGKGFELGFDNRTTGTGMHIIDTSEVDAAGALVKIEQIGDRSGLQPSTGIDINFDTTGNPNSRTIKIDTEQIDGTVIEVDATQIRTGKVLDIDAQRLMSGTGIELHMDLRTTGTGLHIHDDAVSDHPGALVKIEQDGDRSGTAASHVVNINMDTTNNPNSRTVKIDTEQRDGTVIEVDATEITTGRVLAIDADKLTSGKGIELMMDTRTTGTGLHIHDDAATDHAGALVKIEQEGDRSGTAASHVVDINMDTTNNPNSRTIKIDTEQRDGIVVDVDATQITTGKVMRIDADRLTTGTGIELNMDTRTTGTGVHVVDNATSDQIGALIKIEQEGDRSGTAASHVVNINMDTTNNPNSRTIKIDTEQRDGTVVDIDATEITTGRVLAIDADKLTSGKGIELLMDTRTTGTGLHIHDDAATDHAGALVKIEQEGDRSGTAASHVIDINMDTTNNPNSRTIKIDTEQRDGTVIEVDATEIISGRVLAIDADKLTTGKGIELVMDSRTSGTGLHIHDDSTADSAGNLVLIEQKGDRSGNQASRGVYLNFDTTNNANSHAFIIDSEQRDGVVMELDASPLTTGKGIYLHTDNRTTGTGLHIVDDSGTDSAGRLVHIEQKGDRDGTQASIGMEINFDTTANVNARAFKIDSEQTTGIITEIDGYKLTTGTALSLRSVDNLSTGKIIDVHSNSGSTGYRDLVKIHNDNAVATGVRALYILNDAKADRDGTTNVRGETVRFETTAADTNPLLELRNSNTATNTPPILNFIRSASNEADDMSIGTITFEGKDSGNIDTVYAAISARATDKDNTTEAGEVSILVQATDSPSELRNLLRVGKQENSGGTQQAEVVINEDQIDCDFRVETNTSNNAFVVRGDGTEIVFNENSTSDHDLRVESNNSTKMLFVDTGSDLVEIRGPAADDTLIFDVLGNNNTGSAGASLFRVSPTEVVVNESSNDVNFRVEADAADPTQSTADKGTDDGAATFNHLAHDPTAALFVDGSNGRVGLGTSTPATTLHIAGSAHIEGDLWVKGVTNQIDTFVHMTSAVDITNKGTGPALTVTQDGAQPVAAFYDGNNAGSVKYPALYIENGGESGPGNVGIGTTNPEFDLEVLKTGRNDENTQLAITTHSTGTHTSDIILQKSRGTEDSPLSLNDNDVFGRMVFQGWNANKGAWNTGAMIHARAHGEPATGTDTSDMPGELVFSTTGNESETATEHMRIMHTGRVGIGSSATDPMNTVQIDHNGSDLNNGLLIVRNDTTITTNEWLGGVGFDGKTGNVPSSITEAAAYIGAYATETWGTGDKGAKLVFGVKFNDEDDDTTTNQPMEINNTGTVTIKNNHDGNTGLIVDNDHTTGNGTRTAMSIDMDITGNDAATGDRVHTGLFIDVDSSYTGGDLTNEGRLYGIRSEATSSGDNNLVYGAYILGQASGTDANVATGTTNLYGAYIQADQNRSTKNTNQYGVYALSQMDNQGSYTTEGITNSYAVYGRHLNNTQGLAGTVANATGGRFEVECNEGNVTLATGVESIIDRNEQTATPSTISTSYLFKGAYEGTVGSGDSLTGTRWGIHVDGALRNAIEGHLQVGAVTAGSEKTYVTLYADATDGIRVPVGTTAQRPPNSAFGITAAAPTDEQYVPKLGTIRYNTTQSTFEGFGAGNQWGSLGGVIDPDRDTYWTAVNDLDNLHNPGGSKYGTDEFDPVTDYPGDVDYLRAFTTGVKRFAITNTGVSRWYFNNAGTGAVADPYTYQTMLQVTTATAGVTIENPTPNKTLLLKTTGRLTVDGDSGVSIDGSGSEIDITTTGATIDINAATLDIDTTASVDIEAAGKVTIDGATGILLDSPTEINENLTTRSINGRETWYGDIEVTGNANTFYPVSWYGGEQNEVVEIEIYRNYNWTAPDTWYSNTHKGALVFKCQVNFGGWGGTKYDVRVDDVREEYATMIGNMGWFANNRGFAIWLRGGTARYHVRIKGRKTAPTISYADYDPGANSSGVGPILLADITPENVYDYRYQSGRNLRGTNVVLADQLVHEDDTDTYFQFNADDQARIVVGGTSRLNIANTSPHAKVTGDLEVTGDLYVPEEIRHTGDDNCWISFSNTDEISFRTGGYDRAVITNSGFKIKEPGLVMEDGDVKWTVASTKNSGWAQTEITSTNGAYTDYKTDVNTDFDGRMQYAHVTSRMRGDQTTTGGFIFFVPDGSTGTNTLYFNQEGLFTINGENFNIGADDGASIQLKSAVGANVSTRYAEDLLNRTAAQLTTTVAEGGQVTMVGFDTSNYAVKGFANYDVITFDSTNNEIIPIRVGSAYYKYVGWIGAPVKTLATDGVNGTSTKYTAYGDNMTNNVARLFMSTQTGTQEVYRASASGFRLEVDTSIGNGKNLVMDAGTPTKANYNADANRTDAGDILFSGYDIVTSPTKHYLYRVKAQIYTSSANNTASDQWLRIRVGDATDTYNAAQFNGDGSVRFRGDITAFDSGLTSDKRLKKNITTLDSKESLNKILNLRGVSFEWKDREDGTEQLGLIAQEVEEQVPQVIKEAELLDKPDDGKYKHVSYEKLVPLLIESIKEQQSQIDDLKAEIEQLKSQ